ncbi:hypothetical protein SCLCIDRAFT_100751 [Scleroderma citrinum Foug A]|uniref:BED-type domain-containing protein n=2 Tax=Scleroderma citrinum Foug A TaxID=1036808 RepID=A0A0C3ECF7_9AGAM|nr:hypothetical protein SCLCIDRAFT_100751 [Scleroderma citrinum Foug A]
MNLHSKLEVRKNKRNSPIYAFFEKPKVIKQGGHPAHEFKCSRQGCAGRVRRYLDTKDAGSTGNLRKHARSCWGVAVVNAADSAASADEVHKVIIPNILKDGSIAVAFKLKKGATTYSHHQHTREETKGFQCLMKTGHPAYYIPSRWTVSRDVHLVFAQTRNRIATMLQKYNGKLSFTTDAWTSPNHRAFIAFSVHLEHNGVPLSMPLDVVEVARVGDARTSHCV